MKLYRIVGEYPPREIIYTESQVKNLKSYRRGIPPKFEVVIELPGDTMPTTLSEVVMFCSRWIKFLLDPNAKELYKPRELFQFVVYGLRHTIEAMPDANPLPKDSLLYYTITNPLRVAQELKQIREWAEKQSPKVGEDLPLEPNGKPPKRKTRRSKDETSAEALIIGAIKAMLPKRGLDDPPKGKEIAIASDVKNVSRFIRKHWGSQTGFENAWCRDDVKLKLFQLEYAPEHHRGYDDKLSSKGYRHAGKTPGSGDYRD